MVVDVPTSVEGIERQIACHSIFKPLYKYTALPSGLNNAEVLDGIIEE